MTKNETRLRSRLQSVTETQVVEHVERVERLRQEHGHTVKPVRDERGRTQSPFGTCFAFALGLHEDLAYRCIATCDAIQRIERFFAGTAFIRWLVDRGNLEERQGAAPAEGDLVVYFGANGKPVHAGVGLPGGCVRSKWGTGLVWDHGACEVPSSYGDKVRCYVCPGGDDTRAAFLEWLSEQDGFAEFATAHDLLDLIDDPRKTPTR